MRIVKSEFKPNTTSKRLTLKWYKTIINTYDVVCIFFYGDWCRGERRGEHGHEYDKAANIITNLYPRERHQKGKVIMVKVNCDDERVLAKMFNVWNYPTYHIIKNTQQIDLCNHSPDRTAEGFLQFVEQFIDVNDRIHRLPEPDRSRRIYGPIFTERITLKTYKNFVANCDFVLIFFYAHWYKSCKDIVHLFEQANLELSRIYNKHEKQEFALVRMEAGLDQRVIKKFKVKKYPTFQLVIHGVVRHEYESDGTVEGFVNFVKKYKEKHEKDVMAKEFKEEKNVLLSLLEL